jgi:hypothetical protein
MLTSRRLLVAGIVALAGAQCLIWLLLATLGWLFRDFMVGDDPQLLADRTRIALAWIGWFVVNGLGLIAYMVRGRGSSRWLMAGIQAANVVITVWSGYTQVSQYCGQHGIEWFLLSGLAAVTLGLQYVLWRRVDRSTHQGATSASAVPARKGVASLALILLLIVIGLGLIGLSWNFSLQGIQSHSGIVSAIRVEGLTSKVLHLTLDSSPHDFQFSDTFFEPLPDVRVGDRVVILTSQTCGYGSPVAAQSQRGIWIDSIYDFGISPFTPDTWPTHELIRWLALSLGVLVMVAGLASFLRWVG